MGAVADHQIPQWFLDQMKRLLGLKFAPATMQTHWDEMRGCSPELVAAAVEHARHESGEFPTPKMLRVYAEQARPRFVPVPAEIDREVGAANEPIDVPLPGGRVLPMRRIWNYYCETCHDTGLRSFWCGETPSERYPFLELSHCGRRAKKDPWGHYDHEWAGKCACADSNPDVLRKQERYRQGGRRGDNE